MLASMCNALDDSGTIGAVKVVKVDDGNGRRGRVKLVKVWTVGERSDEVGGNTIDGGD